MCLSSTRVGFLFHILIASNFIELKRQNRDGKITILVKTKSQHYRNQPGSYQLQFGFVGCNQWRNRIYNWARWPVCRSSCQCHRHQQKLPSPATFPLLLYIVQNLPSIHLGFLHFHLPKKKQKIFSNNKNFN